MNAASDRNILLLAFIKTSPQIQVRSNRRLSYLINFYRPALYILHLGHVSSCGFLLLSIVYIHSFCLLSISVSLIPSWVYLYGSMPARCSLHSQLKQDLWTSSGKELPLPPGIRLAWLLGWTGPPQHQHLPGKEIRNVSFFALQEILSSNTTLFKSWK